MNLHVRQGNPKTEKELRVLYLGKRASLGRVGGVLLFSVGLAVRVTMIHVLAIGAGV
jgi:hypothetical protein